LIITYFAKRAAKLLSEQHAEAFGKVPGEITVSQVVSLPVPPVKKIKTT
jgi:hypothetical protein